MTAAEELRDKIEKAPLSLIFAMVLAYFAYDYLSFTSDAESPLISMQAQVERIKKENSQVQAKIKAANEFYKTLDQKRAELRSLALELDRMKATLSEELDFPAFMKMVVTEARRVGLGVVSLKPTESKGHEFYVEQAFDLSFKGLYLQLLVFLERLSNVERIVRVDNFDLKRVTSSLGPYVELQGTIQIKTYRYRGSKADTVAKAGGSEATVIKSQSPAPASVQSPAGGSK